MADDREPGWYWMYDSAGWTVSEFDPPVWRYRGEWFTPDRLRAHRVKIGPRILPPALPPGDSDAA